MSIAPKAEWVGDASSALSLLISVVRYDIMTNGRRRAAWGRMGWEEEERGRLRAAVGRPWLGGTMGGREEGVGGSREGKRNGEQEGRAAAVVVSYAKCDTATNEDRH